jgi:hypothetical protein
VLTRSKNHWSQLLSDDNPRGYNEKQQQRIADAGTLVKKRAVELEVMRKRLNSEMYLKEPIDDEYGTDRINAMIADINAEYASDRDVDGDGAVYEEEDGDISEGF